MPRIVPVESEQTDTKTAATLKAAKAKLGSLPNLFTTLARAPAALNGYLQFSEALGVGRLTPRQREMIAIAVAQDNACAYCLIIEIIAHVALNVLTNYVNRVAGTGVDFPVVDLLPAA
jgi:alkylhydroperoxidase family enzyme